ncbi:MAG: GrpB family protein [Angelakisella sp.]
MIQYIIAAEHNPLWAEMYEREAFEIKRILHAELVEIHHIGSTSVKGLRAKPVIDIMPVVKDVAAVDIHNEEFEQLGYECMGEYGMPGRRFFRKGGDNRTHHIHIFQENNRTDILRHLAVRDYLRTHPQVAKEYGDLKAELAEKFHDSIDGYCDGKDAFVKDIEQNALAWYGEQREV